MNPDKIKDALIGARALIATPAEWTQCADRVYEPWPSRAVVSRCASGAIFDMSSLDVSQTEVVSRVLDAIECRTGQRPDWLSSWNDEVERTHAEVLRAFDDAIIQSH